MAEESNTISQPPQQQATKPPVPQTYEQLEEWEQLAIDLHIVWTPYKTIIAELKEQLGHQITAQGLRRCFMKDGRLTEIFEQRKKEHLQQRAKQKEEVQEQLNEGAVEAIGVIRAASRGENISEMQLKAAHDILDRTGYPKTTKLDANGKFESDGLTTVAAGIKAILERKPGVPTRTPQQNG